MKAENRVYPEGLQTSFLGRHFIYYDEIGSTNTWIKENAAALPDGAVCAAALQTAGKGRLGRDWLNHKGEGLMFSFLLKDIDPTASRTLPLVAGLGISVAVEKLCGVATAIKWSNDILINGKKLCGILCESRLCGSSGFAVTGIGLNLTYTRAGLDALGLVYATSLLLDTGKKYGELDTAAAILNELEPMLAMYKEDGFAPFREAYAARCVTLGRDVFVATRDGTQKKAVALDIGGDGSLICSCDGKIEAIGAGEVSVRGLYGYV